MPEEQRTQPEFSPGERLATLEATQGALDRRFDEVTALFDEKLSGLRRELGAINTALKDSVEKAEAAQQRQFQTFVEAEGRKAESMGQRVSAVEQNQAAGRSEKESVVGLQSRQIALVASAATVILAFIGILAATHPFG